MDLQAQVAAAHRVQEVEPDREILAETRLDGRSEDFTGAEENQVIGGKLELDPLHLQQEAVLLGDAVEAPAEVRDLAVQVAHVLHPLASPGSGVEEGNDAEGLAGRLVDAAEESLAGDHLRVSGRIGVDPPVHAREQCIFIVVQNPPVDEQAALVLDGHGILAVVHAQAAHFVAAEALLDFPAGHVCIDQDGMRRSDEGRAGAEDEDILPCRLQFGTDGGEFFRIEEIGQAEVRDVTEENIVRHERIRHPADLRLGLHQVAHSDDPAETGQQAADDFIFMHAGVPVYRKGSPPLPAQRVTDGLPTMKKRAFGACSGVFVVIRAPHICMNIVLVCANI